MNYKDDILKAWILIEQLSEGSINKKDKFLKPLPEQIDNWHEYFKDFLITQKRQQSISDKAFDQSGLVMYFDIFDFEETVNVLRNKYNIPATDEETSNSSKFTISLYFDNQLNFIPDKLFYTMSGYIRYEHKLPKDFHEVENSLRDKLSKKFDEEGFNTIILELFQHYQVSFENFRYKFVKNMENDDISLHSFFIDDLNKAKKIKSENLDRYFCGFLGDRQNLDSEKDSVNFNQSIFEEILQPKFYPLGRFPSNPNFALSFMQQVAVNLALNDKNTMRSVNGPPGTGKTTLLKDIFADLIVQQAIEICELENKEIQGEVIYWKRAKLGILPQSIADKSIIVASSNNGAVQNIVNELPKEEDIAEEFQMNLAEADYFKEISNSELSSEGFGANKEVKSKAIDEKNWGTFSLEGGASTNVSKLLLNIELIEKNLEEEYESNVNVYQEFSDLYKELCSEREKIQKHSEYLKEITEFKNTYRQQSFSYSQGKSVKLNDFNTLRVNATNKLEELKQDRFQLKTRLSNITNELEILNNEQAQAERDYKVITSQKPSVVWLQKIFNKVKIDQYFEKLNNANKILKDLSKRNNSLLNEQAEIKKDLRENDRQRDSYNQTVQNARFELDKWINEQEYILEKLEQKLESMEKYKTEENIREVDFSKTYDELHQSNPWFTKRFRILQTELFISALKVRKQFIFENKKHLKAARNIWSRQKEYISKENGQQLLLESWQWINLTIPVISTTFASFGRMFKNFKEDSISNLFIDEAGQALPQASVGAIFRSKKVMAVGDPSQIEPVLTLDSNVLNLIGKNFKVDDKFVSAEVSTQSLVDAASQYGYKKNEDEWIGIPLWVHRRSNYPMFTISNEISYNGLMVQGKPKNKAQGKSMWYDSTGKAEDKYVKEQAELLKKLIEEKLTETPELADDIYVISPFKYVANRLAGVLDEINFTKRVKGKPANIGTVHTFQGKEAKIVYFVLGADFDSKGAAKWAVSYPNLMNVAATRAKEEFYIIGDKNLYSSLGSKVATTTLSVINAYNK